MARTDSLTNYLTDVATAIKTKKGDNTPIKASEFDAEITNLPSGGGDINDYLETTITSENCEYFFLGNVFKKFPENFVAETTDVTNLLAQYRGTFAPYIDTSNVTRVDAMFANSNLITLPEYNFGNVVRFGSTFTGCTALENIGGFKDLGKAYKTSQSANYARYRLDLSPCTNLTEQSLINVLNKLYDIASLGVQTQQCILGSTNLAKLTSEEGQQALANAQTKGWSIS